MFRLATKKCTKYTLQNTTAPRPASGDATLFPPSPWTSSVPPPAVSRCPPGMGPRRSCCSPTGPTSQRAPTPTSLRQEATGRRWQWPKACLRVFFFLLSFPLDVAPRGTSPWQCAFALNDIFGVSFPCVKDQPNKKGSTKQRVQRAVFFRGQGDKGHSSDRSIRLASRYLLWRRKPRLLSGRG